MKLSAENVCARMKIYYWWGKWDYESTIVKIQQVDEASTSCLVTRFFSLLRAVAYNKRLFWEFNFPAPKKV